MRNIVLIFALLLPLFSQAQTVTPAFSTNPWADRAVNRLVGNVSTGSTGAVIENAIAGQAAVRTVTGSVINVPIRLLTNTALAPIVTAGVRLIPLVRAGLTAAFVIDVLKPKAYEYCSTGWCKAKYPDMPLPDGQTYTGYPGNGPIETNVSSPDAWCKSMLQAANLSPETNANILSTTSGLYFEGYYQCRYSYKWQDPSWQYQNYGHVTASAGTGSCVTLPGGTYSANGGLCVASDKTKVDSSPTEAMQELQTYLDNNRSKAPLLLDNVQNDLKANPAIYTPDLDPVKATDLVTLEASPVTLPETVTNTETTTRPDGTTEQTITKEQATVKPVLNGNTVTNNTVTYNIDNRKTSTTTNLSTGAVTSTVGQATKPAPVEQPKKPEVTDPGILQPTLEQTPTGDEIIAPITGLMPDLRNYVVPTQAGECPKPSIIIFGKTHTLTSHCTIVETVRGPLFAIMMVVYAIAAMFIILGA